MVDNLKITFAVTLVEIADNMYDIVKTSFTPNFVVYITPNQRYVSSVSHPFNKTSFFKEGGFFFTNQTNPNEQKIIFEVYNKDLFIGSAAFDINGFKKLSMESFVFDIFQENISVGKIHFLLRVDPEMYLVVNNCLSSNSTSYIVGLNIYTTSTSYPIQTLEKNQNYYLNLIPHGYTSNQNKTYVYVDNPIKTTTVIYTNVGGFNIL